MTKNDVITHIEEISVPLLNAQGLEIFELTVKKPSTGWMIEMAIDKPMGGIKLDECVKINKMLIKQIDGLQFLGDEYTLLVSSPGLDRPLKTPKEFLRLKDRMIHFILREKVHGRGDWVGRLTVIEDNKVTVDIDGETIAIPYEIITKAVQHLE